MIKFTLLENAFDSIELGLKYFDEAQRDNSKRSYKHCLLTMFHGAELILKEILVRIDPIIIFDKNSLFRYCESPLEPKLEELYQCKSIDVTLLKDAILKYYPKNFNKTKIKIINSLARHRNQMQHFAIEIKPEVLSTLLRELYVEIFKPAFKILQNGLEDISSYNSDLKTQIIDFEKTFLNITNKNEYNVALCPKCESFSHFIMYNGGSYPEETYCICCDFSMKNIQNDMWHECPECGYGALMYDEKSNAGVCVNQKCYYGREGGFVEMEPCKCGDFKIEGRCESCDPED